MWPSFPGLEGRLIVDTLLQANDYRTIAERPNAEFRDCFIQVKSTKRIDGMKWERRVGIFVLSAGKAGKRKGGIRAGEEVLVSYGKGKLIEWSVCSILLSSITICCCQLHG